MALGSLLAIPPVLSPAQTTAITGGAVSSNPMDLCGKWKIENPDGYSTRSSRFFEFFPDGRLVETNTYSSSQGETINSYKKFWKVVGNKILIAGSGEFGNSGQSITIEIPFDLARLQIVETWDSSTSTRMTKMFAVREGGSGVPTASAALQPAASARSPMPKIDVSVVPSIKNDREGYYKTQRLALGILLKNPSVRDSTGLLKVGYWIFGKNSGDSKLFCLFSQGRFECDLGPTASNREFKQTTDTYLNKFYNPSYVSSSSGTYAYEGWIITVSDSENRLVLIKASKPEWERQAAKLQGLNTNNAYDLRLDKIDGASGPYRYY